MSEFHLFIVSAPSGAGKTSLIRALIANDAEASMAISHTTRAQRPGEADGEDYYFVDRDRFEQMVEAGEFLEYAEVFGHLYGTSRRAVDQALARGVHVLLEIDWQGARAVRSARADAVGIFILPRSRAVLAERLRSRGQDSDAVIENRMAKARDEIRHFDEYDHVIVNDDFERALAELESIVQGEPRAPGPGDERIRTLVKELLS